MDPSLCVSVSPLLILIRTLVMGLGPNTSSSQDPSLSDAAKILFPKKLKFMASMWFYLFLGGGFTFSPLQWLSPSCGQDFSGSGHRTGEPHESVSHSVVSDSLRFHELQPTRLLSPWASPGKNTGVGSHSLLQPRDLPNLGIKPRSPALQAVSLSS